MIRWVSKNIEHCSITSFLHGIGDPNPHFLAVDRKSALGSGLRKSQLRSSKLRRNDVIEQCSIFFDTHLIMTSILVEIQPSNRAIISSTLDKIFDQKYIFLPWSGRSTRSGEHPNKFIHGRKSMERSFSKYLLCSWNSSRSRRYRAVGKTLTNFGTISNRHPHDARCGI